jgi:hypothetical protein
MSRPWRLHLDFSYQVESNGWFSAIKLIARISVPGQKPPLGFPIATSAKDWEETFRFLGHPRAADT